jgi:hypothetical protein
MTTLATIVSSTPSALYLGNHGHWIVAATKHRDSDAIQRSNYDYIHTELLERITKAGHTGKQRDIIRVEDFSHWAVGWVHYLLVNPEYPDLTNLVESYHERLESYPILDEDLYSTYDLEDNPQGDE